MRRRILLAAMISVALGANAQEKETKIESVEIYGKILNTPYADVVENIEVISKAEIENMPAKSIDEILQLYTGMDIRRRGGNGVQSDISVRGGSFEQTLILINGVRMNDSQTGHNSMNIPVDLKSVERIEVIKGPAARRFGNGAYSVINIVTKTSSKESATLSMVGGDFKTYNLGLNATFGSEKLSHLFQINSGGSDGYRYNTDYKIRNVFYQNQLKIKNGNLGLQAGIQEKKFGANGFYASPKAIDQYEETMASIVALRLEQKFGKWGVNSNLYWRRGQDMYEYIRNKPEIYRNMHIGNNVGGEINASYQSSLGTTGVGVELRKEYLASNNLGHRDRFLTQMFLEHHFSFLEKKLKIVPGITWANYSNRGNFFYPGLDAGYSWKEHHKVFGNVSKIHRIPSFTDLYYKSPTEQGNADLKPESGWSSEIGYQYNNKIVEAKVSGFMRNSDNAIDWVKASSSNPWSAQNVGNVDLKGIEASWSHQLTQWLDYNLSYTYIDSKNEVANQDFSRYALDYLRHQFIAKAGVKFLKNFRNELSYRYLDRVNLDSYQVLDNQLSYRWKNFDTYLLVNNITATEYTETFGVPMPGRWFHVGISYTL